MRILVADCPLKHLLQLFPPTAPLHIQELGDTWHPSSGYVDEAIVAGVETVGQLLAHDYDFGGLVYFEAELAGLTLRYHAEQYELRGPEKPIWRLLRQVEELNARPDVQPKLQVLSQQPG